MDGLQSFPRVFDRTVAVHHLREWLRAVRLFIAVSSRTKSFRDTKGSITLVTNASGNERLSVQNPLSKILQDVSNVGKCVGSAEYEDCEFLLTINCTSTSVFK